MREGGIPGIYTTRVLVAILLPGIYTTPSSRVHLSDLPHLSYTADHGGKTGYRR